MRILIVEDKKDMARMLKEALEEKGHAAVLAFSGAKGLNYAMVGGFDVIVLDLMLPDLDGYGVARRLREENIFTPILMLTARDAVADKVRALDLGIDDYLTKPFALAELMARLRAVSRRGTALQSSILNCGEVTLDPATTEVRRGDQLVSLTKKEYLLLEFFMRRPDRILSRETIIRGVWGPNTNVEENTLEAFIKLLRQKIDDSRENRLIQTVRGFGYRLHSTS
jgi:DNA-binding response OmpR family regulator